jgi:hypothetical protein
MKWWERLLCWLGWHADGEFVESFHHVPTVKCSRCNQEFEL